MVKKAVWCVLLISFSFAFLSCDLFTMGNKEILTGEETEPAYNANVVWELETKVVRPLVDEMLYGKYLYAIEDTRLYQDLADEFNIIKIDVDQGKMIWRSPTITDEKKSPVIKNGELLFVQGTGDILYCFDDENGMLLATINLGNDAHAWGNGAILSHGNYLYWGTRRTSSNVSTGMVRFDITNINFSKEPIEGQVIETELFWNGQESVRSLAVESEGLIYAITFNGDYRYGGKSILAAIDATTKVEKWRREFISVSEESSPISGRTNQGLSVIGDYLYVVDDGLGCFNKYTGETIWEIAQTREDYEKEVNVSVSTFADGFEYWDGKLYYAGQGSKSSASFWGVPPESQKSIICINANDGSLEWASMASYSGTMGGKPVVVNGKLYILGNERLYVYNAKNGKLIGVKPVNDINNINRPVAYNDMVIYFAPDIANRKSVLTAIRAN